MAQIIGPQAAEPRPSTLGFGSEVDAYINFLKDPTTQIPLESNFLISFDSFPKLLRNNFSRFLENNWSFDKSKREIIASVNSTDGSVFGGKVILFAQGIQAPGEGVEVQRISNVLNGPVGGLLGGVVTQQRTQYPNLEIAFIETNKSFFDFIIRPWITYVGHYGLLTRSPNSSQNIKTTITAVMYDKNNLGTIRKVYKFTGCAPMSVNPFDYAYGKDNPRIDKVVFTFNTFGVQDNLGTG